ICKFYIDKTNNLYNFIIKLFMLIDVATSLVLQGNVRRQTGDGNSGCFGLAENEHITAIRLSRPGIGWTFFSEFGCRGNVLASGNAGTTFSYAVRGARSFQLAC